MSRSDAGEPVSWWVIPYDMSVPPWPNPATLSQPFSHFHSPSHTSTSEPFRPHHSMSPILIKNLPLCPEPQPFTVPTPSFSLNLVLPPSPSWPPTPGTSRAGDTACDLITASLRITGLASPEDGPCGLQALNSFHPETLPSPTAQVLRKTKTPPLALEHCLPPSLPTLRSKHAHNYEAGKNSDISFKATVILHNLSLLPKLKHLFQGFPDGSVVKNPPANARDTGSIPSPGRSHMPQSN